MIGPYKETQAFILGNLLRDRRYIFFFNFASWEESHVIQYRNHVEEKDCILQFLYNDLFRFEPLKGAKIQAHLAQSSVYIFFKNDELSENEIISFLEELLLHPYFLLNFIKFNNFILTKQQFALIVSFGKSSLLEKIGNFYNLLLSQLGYIIFYYFALFQFFCLIKAEKYANLSTVSSEEKKS